jgi:hypothetical protein
MKQKGNVLQICPFKSLGSILFPASFSSTPRERQGREKEGNPGKMTRKRHFFPEKGKIAAISARLWSRCSLAKIGLEGANLLSEVLIGKRQSFLPQLNLGSYDIKFL